MPQAKPRGRAAELTRLCDALYDVTNLARQLARTEDKLERLLQAVEALQSRLDEVAPVVVARGEASSATSRGTRSSAAAVPSPQEGSAATTSNGAARKPANGTTRSRSTAAAKRGTP